MFNELGDIGYSGYTTRRVGQCDQAVRLAATVGRIEAEDCARLATATTEALADVGEKILQSTSGIGIGEKLSGVAVAGTCPAGEDRG